MSTAALIKNLQNKSLYPHPVKYFKVVETHISWVILTGHFAYKIKKPIDFGFLNFTNLDKRKFYCEEELRLNHNLTEDIYLAVVPITGSEEEPQIDGSGTAFEYAIKMREFPQEMILSNLHHNHQLKISHLEQLGKIVAQFHKKIAQNTSSYFGTPEQINEPVKQNFDQIAPFLKHPEQELKPFRDYANQAYETLYPVFKNRKPSGFIRECHGDLHLGNMVLLNDQPTIFDCIEFNESFRFTDTMADVGFLMMDLLYNGLSSFAYRFLNTYLDYSNDYQGLLVLPYYINYRAVVRAKISLLEMAQMDNPNEKQKKYATFEKYMSLALSATAKKPQRIYLTHGVSGSGKSTIAKVIADQLPAVHIRSDIIRKHLAHLNLDRQGNESLNTGLYSEAMHDKTYAQLKTDAEIALNAGFSVILDARFQKRKYRDTVFALSKKTKIPLTIIDCEADKQQIIKWLNLRNQKNTDPSEARPEILNHQYETAEPLTAAEQKHTITICTDTIGSEQEIIDRIIHARAILPESGGSRE